MVKLNLLREMSFEEVKHFFSETDEYEVLRHGNPNTVKIRLRCVKSVTYNNRLEPTYIYHYIEMLVYRPTIQQLIRIIGSAGYSKHAECP